MARPGQLEAQRSYRYAAGTNRLLTASAQGDAVPALAWLHHPAGLPLTQLVLGDGAASRRIA
ncbi:hypothetical protein [Pseudoduganella flava]|uniref:Uncharacterized protein n=1 Tax=Pseudoduganella flava TaxID=871742 RepID=A0ABX6FN61_9BURK|nr:hypothetical protein [Pseudoduganella flava]QGZ38575.1 hypothetical protein GO485_05565 [Pseudoduganella flava]